MLWDKKDNLYAEGLTIRTCDDRNFAFNTFYYYYPNYSDFYISKDFTEINSIFVREEGTNIFNYTFKDGVWATYIGNDMDGIEYIFNNNSSTVLKTVFRASNGFGKQAAVLFQFSSNDTTAYSPNFGVVNIQDHDAIYFKNITKNDYWILMNLTYQESSNIYIFNIDMYDCVKKQWVDSDTRNNFSTLKMPSGYNPQSFSKYFPNFMVTLNYDDNNNSYSFRNFFGYSVNITKAEAEEVINGKFFYSKTNNSMYALYYNECTNLYPNTAFYKDGTILPRGQLVEGAINQVCKNGDIKSQEFIEY